jgi:hypothetical protein
VFNVSPPIDAKVVRVATARAASGPEARHMRGAKHAREHMHEVTGAAAVAQHLPFALDAPSSVAGLSRSSVKLLDMSGHRGALVVYGQGLGSVVVVEQAVGKAAAARSGASSSDNGEPQGLSLPTVAVNGASAQELDTALGTVMRFTRGGVSFIVAGSVSKPVAEAAARGL